MHDPDGLVRCFEENRGRLRSAAYRLLGSTNDAEDAVQEAWLRLSRTNTDEVENLPAWLTTVVARISLNMLRSRATRREDPFAGEESHSVLRAVRDDPEEQALLADSVGLALLVVLEMLTPPERLAFVLHDMFGVPFDEIAPIVGRSSVATRQLASRARRRVRGSEQPPLDLGPQRRIVDAYLAATRNGDFAALINLLHPDVVLRVDAQAMPAGPGMVVRGAENVAHGALASVARARASEPALVDGSVGLMMAPHGQVLVVLRFALKGEMISGIDVIADPNRLRRLQLVASPV